MLNNTGTCWVCENGHSFDIAKQGYINLLPVQQKRSRDPGDDKSMVAARRRFLNAGFYQPIADAVNQAVLSNRISSESMNCLDAGCGEGYYLRQLAKVSHLQRIELLGVDISKWAILAAAKQEPRFNWVVGTNAHVPVASAMIDCILCLFGFPVYTEFARLLKPQGLLLQVDVGPDHLRELRDIVYPTIKPKAEPGIQAANGFTVLGTQSLNYQLSLSSTDEIIDLLAMTPHYYRAGAGGRAKAAALQQITVTVDIRLTRMMPSK